MQFTLEFSVLGLTPVSTGIVDIDSDKFSHLSVSAIPFRESTSNENIELNLEPAQPQQGFGFPFNQQ